MTDYEHDQNEEEDLVINILSSILKQRFNSATDDQIFAIYSTTPSWLPNMMKDDSLRKTLIELLSEKDQSEIGRTVTDQEFFVVFDSLLLDLLPRVR
jgi:hypothetical protein